MKRIQSITGQGHPLSQIIEAAGEAALAAGKIIKDLYGRPHQVKHKGEIDLVTEADLASEKAIIAILKNRLPDISILAEESSAGIASQQKGPCWIVDPLDGTTNFAHSFPIFCVSIAYAVDGVSQAGVIYCPMQDELFFCGKGMGAWLNGELIHVSQVVSLQQSLVATGFPYDVHGTLKEVLGTLERVLPKVQDLRRPGAAAFDLAYLACGRLDGFWEMNLKPWDTAAGSLLVAEAGGQISNFTGEEFSNFYPEIVASNGHIHADMVKLIGL